MAVEPTELRSERLLLRPFRPDDAGDVFAYTVDERFGRFLGDLPRPYRRTDAERMIVGDTSSDWHQHPVFAIQFEGVVIGRISAYMDHRHGRAELGYDLAPAHWGKGLAAEAGRAVIDWIFATYAVEKVTARADAGNDRSWRLMERLGMTREGLLHSHRVLRDGRSDEVVYGLLREAWKKTHATAAEATT